MARAPFQVLVIPFRRMDDGFLYCVFKRSDAGWWQWISGGGEDDESPLDASKREAFEEAGIDENHGFMRLDSSATVPVVGMVGHVPWGDDALVIPEYAYAVELQTGMLVLSHEHTECAWVGYQEAERMLRWDSNRNALWELDYRLKHGAPCVPQTSHEDQHRLTDQIRFIIEVDKLKTIFRRSYITDGTRKENDAEHSWHFALMALLLREYAPAELDVLRVISMALVHDLVEIYAGDTFLYDTEGAQSKAEREQDAANRIFTILPPDQAVEYRGIWDEFEAAESSESKYARALDRLQPTLLNYTAKGRTWQDHGIAFETVRAVNLPVFEAGLPTLRDFVAELLGSSKEQGFFSS